MSSHSAALAKNAYRRIGSDRLAEGRVLKSSPRRAEGALSEAQYRLRAHFWQAAVPMLALLWAGSVWSILA